MNRLMEEKWPTIEGSHGMRDALLDSLSDADLAFSPGGQNVTFGALWREYGEIEHSYVESFKNFTQEWTYRNSEAGLDGSVDRLKAWFQTLDAEMKAAIAALSNNDLKKPIARGFEAAPELQMDIYLQALLIFFGKATIYVRALNRPLPPMFQEWIG